MKSLILIAALMTGSVSFAADVSREALASLMNSNPRAADSEGRVRRVNGLIASIMTSSFDAKGVGTLSVSENGCAPIGSGLHTCTLVILNSDRTIKDDAYVPAEDMTESSLSIVYKYDSVTKRIVGNVSYMFAG